MYGNLTKHKFLRLFDEARNRKNADKFRYLQIDEILVSKFKDFDELVKSVFYLISDGYLEGNPNKDGSVRLTDKGNSVYAGHYYRKENHKLIGTICRDVAMVVANISVAVIAAYALSKDSKTNSPEIQSLQSRLTKLELSTQTKRITKDTVLYLKIRLEDSAKLKPPKDSTK